MHLQGLFGDANVVGNLLVEAAGSGLDHDLTFARAQRFKTLPECFESVVALPRSAITRETHLDRFEEILIAKRLRQEFTGAPFQAGRDKP
jgi:hypothetical protein